jgi:TorA maturation chaperone TorD
MRTLTQLYARHDAVATAAGNRPDYIGVEFDFLRYLSRRELDAWEQGDEALALHYRETACAFIAEHMVPWVGRFCELAIAEAQTDFYRGVARVTKGVINEERNDG